MPFRRRLLAFLATAGCLEPALDDEACLSVPLGKDCPSDEVAEDRLVGTETCESPVREVVATGVFLGQEDVVYTGYGGWDPYPATGPTDPTDTEPSTGSEPQTRCCYEAAYTVHEGQSCMIGRPLLVAGRMVSAPARPGAGWARGRVTRVGALTAEERVRLAERWTEAGLLEHASVAAFGRVVLDLVALGAPAGLVARTAEALADEVRHAEGCFAIASACAGSPIGPGPLPVPRRGRPSLRRLAVEAFREGCVGETLAVGDAARELRTATSPEVRELLARIVADETRHAELAWDTVRWAIAVGGAPVRRAVAREVGRLAAPADPWLAALVAEVVRPEAAHLLAAA